MRYERLASERKKNGFTQLQAAVYLGLSSRQAYAQKEHGERGFRLEEALALARLFDESVETLFASRDVTNMDTERTDLSVSA